MSVLNTSSLRQEFTGNSFCHTNLRMAVIVAGLLGMAGCGSLPVVNQKRYAFPKDSVFIGDVKRPYQVLGLVRAKVNFPTLDPSHEENELCQIYFNKAARQLLSMAQEKGGEGVIDMKSVVFMEDGQTELYTTPECSDDGAEGQVLAQGIAVKWVK